MAASRRFRRVGGSSRSAERRLRRQFEPGYTSEPHPSMRFVSLLYPWGILLQVLAMVHFIRRRPDNTWLWVIVFFGPPGALVYILMEVVPDLALLRDSMEGVKRRKRINHLEAVVMQNPAP